MNRSAQHAFEPEEIMAYLDGELEPHRASALAAHLDHCVECRSIAAGLRRVSDQLAAWEVEPSPRRLTEHVSKAVHEQARPKTGDTVGFKQGLLRGFFSWQRRPWAWALGGALATAFLAFAFMRIQQREFSRGIASQKAERPSAYLGWLQSTDTKSPVTRPLPGIARDSNGLFHGLGDHPENSFTRDGQPITDQQGKVISNQPPLLSAAQEPMIARTAALSILVKDFGPVEAAVKGITGRHHGYIGELNTVTPQDAARQLTATLRVPSPQLDAAFAELKQLGRVEQESQSGEEVSKQYTDLVARLKKSRATEQRLVEVLRNNTGKVKDVLDVEKEIARVRGEIEQMEADQRDLKTRVDYATLQLSVGEDFRASLQVAPPSTATRLHNALVEGYHGVVESVIGFAVWLLAVGPALLIWGALLFFPARWAWKRWRRAAAEKASSASAA